VCVCVCVCVDNMGRGGSTWVCVYVNAEGLLPLNGMCVCVCARMRACME
jgi:hypothetical protein